MNWNIFKKDKVGSEEWLNTYVEIKRSWMVKVMRRLDELERNQ